MIEMLIAIAILTVLSAAVTPALTIVSDKERYDVIESMLREIEVAVNRFRTKVGVNPGKLHHLSTLITVADSSPCILYKAGEVAAWAGTPPTGGPYMEEALPAGVFAIHTLGIANPDLVRNPLAQGGNQQVHFLSYQIANVAHNDALEVNERIDGNADHNPETLANGTGTIQWGTPDPQGFVTLTYRMLVPKNTC